MNEQGKKLLNGRYEIIRPIGYGGMAEVFLGKDILLERSVAIKMLRNQFHQEKELLEQFQREAKSAAKLVHPNIINVYDVVSDDSNQYIVMEYVEGVTLKEYISGNKLSLENVLKMSIRLADALQHAHKKNIIHCDIKPQNILLDKDLNPKIADFGIAKIVSNQTMVYSNAVMGSVHYISPEQAEGTQVTACSDVYSLGIVMFEMLTGKVPYTGDSAFAVMRMHTEKEVPQLKDYMENVPAGLQEIIDKALAKKVTERYGDAESFKQDLLALKTSLFPYSKNEYSLGTVAGNLIINDQINGASFGQFAFSLRILRQYASAILCRNFFSFNLSDFKAGIGKYFFSLNHHKAFKVRNFRKFAAFTYFQIDHTSPAYLSAGSRSLLHNRSHSKFFRISVFFLKLYFEAFLFQNTLRFHNGHIYNFRYRIRLVGES